MIFIGKDDLALIQLTEETERLSFRDIEGALPDHFCDAVYAIYQNRLYGMVTYGDALRAHHAGEQDVSLNRRFRSVKPSDYIEAREIFRDHYRIHHLPVIDSDGIFLGVFSRFDDLLYLKYCSSWEHDRFAGRYFAWHSRIQLVRPVGKGNTRQTLYDAWKKQLTRYGCTVRETAWDDIEDVRKNNGLILYTDEEEKRGAAYMRMLKNLPFNTDNSMTYCELLRAVNAPPAELIFQDLEARGIHVVILSARPKDSSYQLQLRQAFAERAQKYQSDLSCVHDDEACAFYGEDCTPEYAAAVGRHMFIMEKQNSFTRLKDGDEPYFHITNGERLTAGQPAKAAHEIYFFGPCLTVGSYVEDKHTVESHLQQMLNEQGYSCRVINCGSWGTVYSLLTRITSTPMRPGDTAVIFESSFVYEGFEQIDLYEVLENNSVPASWLTDSPVHCNSQVNRLYAEAVMAKMKDAGYLQKDAGPEYERNTDLCVSAEAVNLLYIDRYFYGMKDKFQHGRTGNISMHANPFTLGHRYLAEYAATHTDHLIISLIEEEQGIFSFAERYAMTCEALKDLDNVTIVPAGPFQANRAVFPDYFVKTADTFEKNAENDSRIFGSLIAPALCIRYRFVGDEEHNPKMKRFNRILSEVLGEYGIETVIIERAREDGSVISASQVRKMDEEEARKYVPASTLRIMKGILADVRRCTVCPYTDGESIV